MASPQNLTPNQRLAVFHQRYADIERLAACGDILPLERRRLLEAARDAVGGVFVTSDTSAGTTKYADPTEYLKFRDRERQRLKRLREKAKREQLAGSAMGEHA